MIILFQNILFLKEFLAWNGCFGLFTEIKKGSGTSVWCIFSVWFSNENVSHLILYQWTKFQCHNFSPSQDIKQNVLLSSYLYGWWCHKLLKFVFNQPLRQWLTERKKRGRQIYKKFKISRTNRVFRMKQGSLSEVSLCDWISELWKASYFF